MSWSGNVEVNQVTKMLKMKKGEEIVSKTQTKIDLFCYLLSKVCSRWFDIDINKYIGIYQNISFSWIKTKFRILSGNNIYWKILCICKILYQFSMDMKLQPLNNYLSYKKSGY